MKVFCLDRERTKQVTNVTTRDQCAFCPHWDNCEISRFRDKQGELIDEVN